MTVQNVTGPLHFYLPIWPGPSGLAAASSIYPTTTDLTIDATNEAVAYIGRCMLAGRTGNKTISSSGGSIHWLTGDAVTFANAGTTLRVGIQDIDTTSSSAPPAQPDGTFDVYADLVGATDTITADTVHDTAMESGSKTITHGQLIAVVLQLTARAGADSIELRHMNLSRQGNLPTTNLFTTSWSAGSACPNVLIEFDDGTYGFIDGGFPFESMATYTFANDDTPDERGNIFRVPFPMNVDALWASVTPNNDSANFELVLYSDPLGTPAAIETLTIDGQETGTQGGMTSVVATLATVRSLSANTDYAVTVRPTSTNDALLRYFTVATAAHLAAHPMGTDSNMVSRSNQTGAFGETTDERAFCGVRACGFGDDTGGGGLALPVVRHP